MLARMLLSALMFCGVVYGQDRDYCLAFVHIGKRLPVYFTDTLAQVRMFNPTCTMYLIANREALQHSEDDYSDTLTLIPIEDIKKTDIHEKFNRSTTLNKVSRNGFWRYASERFLYLYDFMIQYTITHLFHIENDVMVYVDLAELFPVFRTYYVGVGATFDNDTSAIPGFVYVADVAAMAVIAQGLADNASKGMNDMQIFGLCRQHALVQHLPIIMSEYVQKHALISPSKHTVQNPKLYCNNMEHFNSIFDAAALGQYLGGIDPRNGISAPGFINESCVVNPSYLKYTWKIDACGRRVPYARYKDAEYRINNLHIHCKNMKPFMS